MKIGIVTVYNSPNCGSYLQAVSLKHYLEKNNHTVVFIKNKTAAKNRLLYRAALAFKALLKGEYQKFKRVFVSWWAFVRAQKVFDVVDINVKDIDAYILGSDTIWNIDDPFFEKKINVFFGGAFTGYKISYAASIGDTKIEKLLENELVTKNIKTINHISARDSQTLSMLKKLGIEKELSYVDDPTMLNDTGYYNSIEKRCEEESPFLLYYYFGHLDDILRMEIKKYAQIKGLMIIAFGENIKECDKYIPFDPLKMLSYFRKAHTIITNTFHGNVFSIIYNKKFVNIEAKKCKVNDLLKKYDLCGRTVDRVEDMQDVLNTDIDYISINKKLEEARKESEYFIKNALSGTF